MIREITKIALTPEAAWVAAFVLLAGLGVRRFVREWRADEAAWKARVKGHRS